MAFKIIPDDESDEECAARLARNADAKRRSAFEYLNAPQVAESLDGVKRQIGIVLTTLHKLGLTADEARELLGCSIDLRWHHDRTPSSRAFDVYVQYHRRPPDQSNETWQRMVRREAQDYRAIEALPDDARCAVDRDDECARRIIDRIVRTKYEALPPDWNPFDPDEPPPER